MPAALDTVADRDRESRLVALYEACSPGLARFIGRLTHDEQATEDLLQETMLRAWRHIDDLPPDDEGIRRWLFTVARRLVIDSVRLRHHQPVTSTALDLTLMPADDDTIAAALAGQTVRHAFDRLSLAHRAVLSEVFLHGHTPEQAAERLGLPVGTVKSRTHYALRALRTGIAA
ncbi:sigma-70 family RNA polymerase sigma factor [Actinoplanes sp. TRM 88003]|uniref:Sigma-70 family RNA polymerase sigma factor n=1 Tax=Paractinoplanes aksuensis TaxID=2939490 RepID=A0ABT1DZ86_9ACTN|nr:sigma-70 family RNA polymerase sigma factor [Actinoplanes aksuensis]MCO8275215.1 sigma-70 family RNA polymerase sigma factor [Actinoplanes aksuensis]